MERLLVALICFVLTGCSASSEREHHPTVRVQTLVGGTPLHGIQGLTWGRDGYLYAAAIAAQTLSRVDPKTGAVEVLVGAPDGESDDVDLGPDGTLVWTAMVAGELRIKRPGEPVEVLATGLPGLNPVAFSPDGRLFAVTMGDPSRLWEFYLDGQKEPRLVSDQIKILNSFDFAPDGTLYGPYWSSGELVKIDVNTGEATILAEDLGAPTAVELDSHGRLVSVDYRTGAITRTNPVTGESVVLAQVEPPLDNLAIGPDDTIYVSESATSGIAAISPDGTPLYQLTGGEFSTPGGLDMMMIDGKESLVVADSTGYRFVDPQTGVVTRMPYELGVGSGINVAAADDFLVLTDGRSGRVQMMDPITREVFHQSADFDRPYGVDILSNGDVLIVDHGDGTLLRWTGNESHAVAEGLKAPVGLTIESPTTVLVSENDPGAIVRIDLANGATTKVFQGLNRPEGITLMADGRLAVAEVGAGRVVALDMDDNSLTALADGLQFGVALVRAPPSVGFPTGVAVGRDGTLYVSEDGRNAIVKIEVN